MWDCRETTEAIFRGFYYFLNYITPSLKDIVLVRSKYCLFDDLNQVMEQTLPPQSGKLGSLAIFTAGNRVEWKCNSEVNLNRVW